VIPTALVLTALIFLTTIVIGAVIAHHKPSIPTWLLTVILMVCCLPALGFAGYYLHLIDEPVLLYRLRALPGSELSAGLIGFPTGWLGLRLGRHPLRAVRLSTIGLAIAPMLLLIPYAKPLLTPLDRSMLRDHWSNGICLQSTGSTCGPSSAATVLRFLGKDGDEATLASEAQTSASGTEIWYLARALQARGCATSFVATAANPAELPYPSIAGTRMGVAGHFIAVLDREGDNYVIGDPLEGRSLLPRSQIGTSRYFTGFFLRVGVAP